MTEKKLESHGRAEHQGFCKAAMGHMAVKMLNKGRQVLQGGARGKTLDAAKNLRLDRQSKRNYSRAQKAFGGHAKVEGMPPGGTYSSWQDATATAAAVGKRNARIAGGALGVAAGAGAYAAS